MEYKEETIQETLTQVKRELIVSPEEMFALRRVFSEAWRAIYGREHPWVEGETIADVLRTMSLQTRNGHQVLLELVERK